MARLDLPTSQALIRRILECLTIDANGDIHNDFFSLTRAQVRQRFANVNLQEFNEIEPNPMGWRLLYDSITRRRPPNTRTNVNALDTLLREVQYDPVIQFALDEFQDETDDRFMAMIRLVEMFQEVLPYYEAKMMYGLEVVRILELYERQRTRLPQFLTEFYVGDVVKEAGIELSREILGKHRQLARALNAYYRHGPAELPPPVRAWVPRCNINLQLNIFDINILRTAIRDDNWQGIHLISNRELSLIDFPQLTVLHDADLVVIEKIGNLPAAPPPSTASLKLRGITELVRKEIYNWETVPIEDLSIEEVEQRTCKHSQVDRSLNDYIMATGRDFATIRVNDSEYDVSDTLSTIKTQLVARRRYLEKVEKQEEAALKNKRTLINKSVPKYKLQKLSGEENFLCWMNEYDMLKGLIGNDELKLVALIKESLEDKDDEKVTQKMTKLNDILKYLYKKYLNSSSLLTSTLKPIMSLNAPKSMAACVKNIEEVINIFQVLQANNVIERIDGDRLTKIETKCLTKQGLVDYYQAKALARNASGANRGIGELVDNTIADGLGLPQLPGASSTFVQRPQLDYTQLSFKEEIRKLISSESIEFRRDFFINYVERKLEIFRSTMAAERTAESMLAEAHAHQKKDAPKIKKQERIFSTIESNGNKKSGRPKGPLKPCPFNCGKEHPWGSGAFCETFRSIPDVEERINIVKTFGINKCCLKKMKHTAEKPCRAKLCSCGAAHHELLCKRKKSIQTIHKIKEQNNDDDDNDDDDDKDDNNDEEDDLTENHNHVQEEDGKMPPDTDYLEESDEEEDAMDNDGPNESNEDEVDDDTQINASDDEEETNYVEENEEDTEALDEVNQEEDRVDSEPDQESEEEGDIRIFSIREEDTITLLDSEEVNEEQTKHPQSIQNYLAEAKAKMKKPFVKTKSKNTNKKKQNMHVTFAEYEEIGFETKPTKLDWKKIEAEGEDTMKAFESEEQKVLLVEQEIMQMNLETTLQTLQEEKERKIGMPPHVRFQISGRLAEKITSLSQDMEKLSDIEWTTSVIENYITQVETLGKTVEGILNGEGDIAVPQFVALPTKLAQVVELSMYMLPEGWIIMAKKALLKLLEQKSTEKEKPWKEQLKNEAAGSTKTLRGPVKTTNSPFRVAKPPNKATGAERPHRWPPPTINDVTHRRDEKNTKNRYGDAIFNIISKFQNNNPQIFNGKKDDGLMTVGPNDKKHNKTYKNLCDQAGSLYKLRKRNSYGMIVKLRILVSKKIKVTKDEDLNIITDNGQNYIDVLGILDCGADASIMCSELKDSFSFTTTKTETVTYLTVNKKEKRLVDRTKISLLTNEDEVVNIESTSSKWIGSEKQMDKKWLSTAKEELDFKQEHENLFNFTRKGKVRVIVGLKNLKHLARDIPVESLGMKSAPTSPNLGIYYSALDYEKKLILAGSLGLNEDLFDEKFPHFTVPTNGLSHKTKSKEEETDVSEEELRFFLTKTECNDMKNFLEEETILNPENKKCDLHTKAIKNCTDCGLLNKLKSLEDQELYKTIESNMRAEKEGENYRLVQKMVFNKPEEELFNPNNTNYEEALKSSKAMLYRLKKLGSDKVEEYDSQIRKSVKDGCFEKLTEDEIKNLEHTPHYFTMGNMVYNENSSSTSVRFVNDTARPIKGQMASVSTSNYCPRKVLNDMYKTITRFLLYETGYSSDVKGAYRGVKCTYNDSFLRLYVWFDDLNDPDGSVIILRRKSLDFGDGHASASLEIGCNKFVAGWVKLEISKMIIRNFRYADNNLYSFKDKLLYFLVKKDIEEAFAKFSLPLKYTITNLDVDPTITAQFKLFDGHIERQMGLNWDIASNTILPSVTLNIHGKKRGKRIGENLDETDLDNCKITRRHLMRLCSQLHDYTERHIGPVKSSMKLLVSRSCDIVDAANIDKPLDNFDESFAITCKTFIKNLQKMKDLKPYKRYTIPSGYKLNHLVVTRDGGGGGFAATVHFVSKLEPGKIGPMWHSYIMAAKSKISKRSPQANELLATYLAALLIKLVLSGLTELNTEKFDIYCPGDSVCVSSFYDKRKQIKNVLVRNAVESCKSALDDVVNIFPLCKIRYTWLAATFNVSDVMTKLTMDPIRICNSEIWRSGHEIFTNEEEMKKNTFYEVTLHSREYIPLPDHLTGIKQNLQAAAALNKSYDSVSKKEGDVQGIELETQKPDERVMMVKTRSNTNKQATKKQENESDSKEPAEEETDKATSRLYSLPKQLVVGSYQPYYTGIMDAEFYNNIMQKYSTIGKTFFLMKKIISFLLKMKYARQKTKLPDDINFNMECWLAMLRTSQSINTCKKLKSISTKTITGISVALFRLSDLDSKKIFGSNSLPIVQDDCLLNKLITEAHTEEVSGLGKIHLTITATCARIKSNLFKVISPNLRNKVSKFVNNCPICLRESLKFYKAPQGDKYTKIRTEKVVMSELSADILGNINLLPYKGAKRPFKYYPIVYVDINFGCLVMDLLDSYATDAVKMSLKKLQTNYSEIEYLSTDKGSQLIKSNLEDDKMFPRMIVRNHQVNSQHRNYVERNISTVKKYMRTVLGKVKKEKLPCLTILQAQYLLSHVESVINKTQYTSDPESIYLCPKTFLFPAAPIRLSDIEEKPMDNGKLREFIALANKLRKEQIIDATSNYCHSDMTRNKRNVKEDVPKINDIAYIHEENKFQPPRYAKIVGFKSKQTAITLSKRGLEEHPIINLHPFVKAEP